jgi:hypothetical protein
MNKHLAFAALLGITVGCSKPPVPADETITRADNQVDIVSKVYHVDKIYKSMTGPWSQLKVKLIDSPKPELVWITGARVEMLDAEGRKRMPDEYMCHANIDIDATTHCEQFGISKRLDGRLFTLSQGQLAVKFPEGTGIPVRSDLPLDLTTQVLNLNLKDANFDVRHHVTIDIVRDCDVKGKMIPLYETGISGQVSLEGGALAYDFEDHGTGSQIMGMCIPGQKAMDWEEHEDRFGRKFTAHWVVPPGREVNRTRCTSIMNVPFDSKIHAIAVHMHPFAESLEFRDVSENKTLFHSEAKNYPDKIGLMHVDSLASPEGLPVYQGHEYELVSAYNNTSGADVDSMAVMYLYVEDTEFDKDLALRRLALPLDQTDVAEGGKSSDRPHM